MKTNIDRVNILIAQRQLIKWGNWCKLIISSGLGFSSVSLLGQIEKYKGEIVKSSAKMLFPSNIEAEEIDSLIIELSKKSLKQANVLYKHYVDEASSLDKVKRIGCSKDSYYRLLRDGEQWIAANL
jgi:hypothetical protein